MFKTKRILLLIMMGCLLVHTGCTDAPTTSAVDDTNHSAILNNELPIKDTDIIKEVMRGEKDFFETGIGQNLNIKDLWKVVSSDSTVKAEVEKFTVIDLDGDGIDEVVLWIKANGIDYGCEILRYDGEDVYGYLMWYRAFNGLKEDGTFSFSGGAADSGFGKLKFEGKTCNTEKISYSESDYDSDDEITVSFFVNGEDTSKELFEMEIQKQDEKKDAVWYDFTDENIAAGQNEPAGELASQQDTAQIIMLNVLKEITGAESDSLEKQFFLYYQAHNYELAMMPVFEKNSLPNWDDLTLFVLLNNDNQMTIDGVQALTAETFTQTVTRFFGTVKYSDKSSKHMTFKDGIYTAVPGDTMRSGYFWLKEMDAVDSEYTATFDAFYFGDMDFTADYEQATPNQRAVRDQAGTKDFLQPLPFASAMLEILENEDYASILDVSETVTITFSLSNDPKNPLTYTSCSVQKSN